MFNQHRGSPWFQEKYSPLHEFANLRRRTRQRGWRARMPAFLDALDGGKFDPVLGAAPGSAPTDAAPATKEEDGAEPAADGAAADDAKEEPADDDAQETETKTETNGHGHARVEPGADAEPADRARSSGPPRGAEMSVPNDANQVMIRTIPPDIGRLKLERVRAARLRTSHRGMANAGSHAQAIGELPGFVYVALGDPMQKRSFYRAGWVKFREDTDMSVVMNELHEKKVKPASFS
jgi:hypothetical protein